MMTSHRRAEADAQLKVDLVRTKSAVQPEFAELSAARSIGPSFGAGLGVELTVELGVGLDALSATDWDALFPDHPDSFENVRLTQACGMDGFDFRLILVRQGPTVVLAIPTFVSTFDISSLAEGRWRGLLRRTARVFPRLLRPRLCGIGLVEGEWGSIGVRTGLDTATASAAWTLATETLTVHAKNSRAHLLVLLDIAPRILNEIPKAYLDGFSHVSTSPCAQVPLPFSHVDEYVSSLSRSTRQGLRRKLRANAQVRIERTSDPSLHLPRMIELYEQTVARSPVVLGVQRHAYFERVGREVPGVQFVLYFVGDELLAFNVLIARGRVLIDKYFCMDAEAGRKHSLYFVSWMENIRHGIEEGFRVYHAGPGAHDTKCHLGSRFIRTATLFRHQSPVVHGVLKRLAKIAVKDTSTTGVDADMERTPMVPAPRTGAV